MFLLSSPRPHAGPSLVPAAEPPKVLLVVSSEGRPDAVGKQERPGFEMDELAQAWLVLRANGAMFDLPRDTALATLPPG
jgi:hypothetical protein